MANRKKRWRQTIYLLFPTFLSSVSHHKRVFKIALFYTLLILIFSFLFFNIILTQLISPVYYQMTNDNQNAVVKYLQSIRQTPQFSSELSKLKNAYGASIENVVFRKETEEKSLIQNYEQILRKNPYARDILLSLFFLYSERGNKKLAQEYLERAKKVDPNILNSKSQAPKNKQYPMYQ